MDEETDKQENTENIATETPDVMEIDLDNVEPQEAPENDTTPDISEIQRQNKELADKLRELETKIQQTQTPEPVAVQEVGKKPKLEDFDYEADKFEAALEEWVTKKKNQEAPTVSDWDKKLQGFYTRRKEIKAPDYITAENAVAAALTPAQQGVIIAAASDPAVIVYALGKNKSELTRLSSIKDPVQLGIEIHKIESKVKVKTKAPPPEKTISSSSPTTSSLSNSRLEQLRKEAEKSGDYSKVVQFKKQLKRSA